ncbi:MAG: helix-turn-helix transcriptional regulator [Chloroflexota bacterium]|nr:MAG: helix-turn-helix transcriptional regulator [Chloroflexota bacterium]
MKQRQVSIRQLSRATGITYTTIRAVYHGQRRSIQLEVLDAICATLRIQPGDIYNHVPAAGEPVSQAIKVSSSPAREEARAKEGRPRSGKGDVEDDWRNW